MMMGLLKYFCPVEPKEDLPNPNSKLSEKVPFSSSAQANSLVCNKLEQQCCIQGPYVALTPAQGFSIGKRAAENGVITTFQYYAKAFPDVSLKETTVQKIKNHCLFHLKM